MEGVGEKISLLMKLLRDPIWQSISVLLAVIAIFVATTTSTSNRELAVIHTQNIKFADYLLPSNLIKLQLQKSGQDVDNVVIEYYLILNKGDKPILPEDYISALTVEQSTSHRKILLVDSCVLPQQGERKSATSCDMGSFVPSTWENKGRKWLANAVLLNSGENLCVIVLTQSVNQENESEIMSTQWGGRIVGTQIKTYASQENYYKSLQRKWTDYFVTQIQIEGFGAYWFILLQVTAFYATAMLARQAKWLVFRPLKFSRLILIMLLSTSTAEILVDIFVNQRERSQLSPVVWPLLIAHAVLILYLFVRSLKIRLAR